MKSNHVVLGIHITNRLRNASAVQKVFTEFGCNIKTRLGLHEVADNHCSGEGIVILELIGDDKVRKEMTQQLQAIEGVEVKEMVFTHQ